MTNRLVVALIKDLQISALLAKYVELKSYDLIFCSDFNEIDFKNKIDILAIDLELIQERHLCFVKKINNNRLICLGYCLSVDNKIIKYFKSYGFAMVLTRSNFIKNLNTILETSLIGS